VEKRLIGSGCRLDSDGQATSPRFRLNIIVGDVTLPNGALFITLCPKFVTGAWSWRFATCLMATETEISAALSAYMPQEGPHLFLTLRIASMVSSLA